MQNQLFRKRPSSIDHSGASTVQPRPVRPTDVGSPPEAFEGADEDSGGVDLAAVYAVASAGGVGMVQVVPTLTHRDERERPAIGRLVATVERAAAYDVTDRVDRPGDVMQNEHAHQARPQERR